MFNNSKSNVTFGQNINVNQLATDIINIDGVDNISDDSIDNTTNVIYHSEFVIGLSSGLSWLSWALGKHVVMISNFTEANHEFNINCTRITNPLVCNGCWNNPKFKFDKGDWYWCPEHKGTERQFECHKTISPETRQKCIDLNTFLNTKYPHSELICFRKKIPLYSHCSFYNKTDNYNTIISKLIPILIIYASLILIASVTILYWLR